MPVTTTTLPTAEAYRLLLSRDAGLLTALRAHDPVVRDAVSRVLRLTPLAMLAAHPSAAVEALAVLPEVERSLQTRWNAQDSRIAGRLAMWAEQARRHHHLTAAA